MIQGYQTRDKEVVIFAACGVTVPREFCVGAPLTKRSKVKSSGEQEPLVLSSQYQVDRKRFVTLV